MKQINITNGQGIIKIKTTDIGSYFTLKKPLSVIWCDCDGSIAQYFALTHYSKLEQKIITENLKSNLYDNYSEKTEDVFSDFKGLFELLENGTYEVNFEIFSKLDHWKQVDDLIFLAYNEDIRMTSSYLFDKYKKIEETSNAWKLQDKITYFSKWFYDDSCGHSNFLFTRAMETINFQQVKFYESEILNGKFPFAILMRKEFTHQEGNTMAHQDSGWYILDGHHKLLAYHNLKIPPRLLKIKQIVTNLEYDNFDITELEPVLMGCQLEHIRKNL